MQRHEVRIKKSGLPGAGNGLFAGQPLRQGNVMFLEAMLHEDDSPESVKPKYDCDVEYITKPDDMSTTVLEDFVADADPGKMIVENPAALINKAPDTDYFNVPMVANPFIAHQQLMTAHEQQTPAKVYMLILTKNAPEGVELLTNYGPGFPRAKYIVEVSRSRIGGALLGHDWGVHHKLFGQVRALLVTCVCVRVLYPA